MADSLAPRIDVRLASDERGAVATVTVDNRAKLNTLDSTLMREFVAQIEALSVSTPSCTPSTAKPKRLLNAFLNRKR